jgi:hypothetical protein
MSMTLPVDKLVTIIRAFSYDISSIVQNNDGYVLNTWETQLSHSFHLVINYWLAKRGSNAQNP